MARAYPINSSEDAVTIPGVNDYDLNRVPTEFFEEGVVRGFAVTERGAGANMSVDIAVGLAIIEITNTNVTHGKTYKTWFEETITTNKAITTADATNPRKDRVVLRVDVSTDPDVSAANIAIIEVIAGTPAGSPSAPAEPSNATTLAIIDIPASDTTIANAQITDSRTLVALESAVLPGVQREATAITKTRAAFNDFTEKTIATGAIAVDQVLHTIDTEADAASDDLDTITAAVGSGEMVHIKAENTARTVVVKHNTGNIKLADAADFSLDDTEKSLTLIRKGSTWHELARGAAASSAFTKLHATITDGTAVGQSTTSQTDLDQTYDLAANSLAAGDVIKIDIYGNLRVPSGSIIKLFLDAVEIASITTDFDNGGAEVDFQLSGEFTVRTIGGSGTIQPSMAFRVGAPTSSIDQYYLDANDAPVTVDTTQALTIKGTVQPGSSNPAYNMKPLRFNVYKIR